jgi:hypothetical protein
MSLGSSSASSAPYTAAISEGIRAAGNFGMAQAFDDAPADTYDLVRSTRCVRECSADRSHTDSNRVGQPILAIRDTVINPRNSSADFALQCIQGNASGRGGSSAFASAESASSGGIAFNFGSDAPVVTAQRKMRALFDRCTMSSHCAEYAPTSKSAGSGGVFTTSRWYQLPGASVYFPEIPDEIQVRRISPLLVSADHFYWCSILLVQSRFFVSSACAA